MVWKKVKQYSQREQESISKKAHSIKNRPMFLSHTRLAREINQAINCKLTVGKKLTNDQMVLYNQILEEQRDKQEKYVKRFKKKNAITIE